MGTAWWLKRSKMEKCVSQVSEVDIEEMFTYADQVSKYDIGVYM